MYICRLKMVVCNLQMVICSLQIYFSLGFAKILNGVSKVWRTPFAFFLLGCLLPNVLICPLAIVLRKKIRIFAAQHPYYS